MTAPPPPGGLRAARGHAAWTAIGRTSGEVGGASAWGTHVPCAPTYGPTTCAGPAPWGPSSSLSPLPPLPPDGAYHVAPPPSSPPSPPAPLPPAPSPTCTSPSTSAAPPAPIAGPPARGACSAAPARGTSTPCGSGGGAASTCSGGTVHVCTTGHRGRAGAVACVGVLRDHVRFVGLVHRAQRCSPADIPPAPVVFVEMIAEPRILG